MTSAQNWKSFFTEWPAALPRGGIMVSVLNETIPFRRFWLKGDMLLLERTLPDANGGRFLIIGFESINSVKFVTPLNDAAVADAGFVACGDDSLLLTV